MSYPEQPQNYPQDPNFQGQNPYQQNTFIQNSPEQMQGQKLAQMSLIFGIISLFIGGLVFGPLAIWKANQAEKLNTAATAGKVTGWIGTILALGFVMVWILLIIVGGEISSSSMEVNDLIAG